MTMQLVQEDVDKFRKAYEAETNENITNEEAWEMATRLLDLGQIVMDWQVETERLVCFDKDNNI